MIKSDSSGVLGPFTLPYNIIRLRWSHTIKVNLQYEFDHSVVRIYYKVVQTL